MSSSFFTIHSRQHYRLRAVTVQADCLIVILNGEKRLHTQHGTYRVKAGQALAIARGSCVDLENIPSLQGVYLAKVLSFSEASIFRFTHGDVDASSKKWVSVFQKIAFHTSFAECFNHACKALEERHQYSEKIQEHRVQEVLLTLSGQGVEFAPITQLSWSARIRQLVSQRPSEHWDRKRVAQVFHLSPSSLQRRLAGEGKSLASCVRESRLEIAMGLLQSTQTPIYDIVQKCGYSSGSKFSIAFRKRYGVLPSQLR